MSIEGEGKSCFRCRYNGGSWPAGQNRKCVSPHLPLVSAAVEGRELRQPSKCDYQRSKLWRFLGFNTCGPEARFWKQP